MGGARIQQQKIKPQKKDNQLRRRASSLHKQRRCIDFVVPMATDGRRGDGGDGWGGWTKQWDDTLTAHAYFEGFLCVLAGADDDEARSSHAAEALQVQPLQHRHGRHGVVL